MGKLRTNRLLIMTMFILLLCVELCSCGGNSNSSSWVKLGCKPSERKALLNFKNSLTILHNRFVWSSWEGEDCCSWRRVWCDPATGHVVQLHLHGNDYFHYLFEAEETESSLQHLLELNHLEHLDVSINNFANTRIPKLMGSMKQLRYLNLSRGSLNVVAHHLGNLTNLQVLDVGFNDLIVDNLKWVSNLRELHYLGLDDADLSQAHDWVDSLIYGPFSSLRELHLSFCVLPTYPTHSSLKNSSLPNPHIRYLDLSENYLNGGFPHFIQNMTSLEYLDLSSNSFGTQIPLWLGKLKSLTHLNLKANGFQGIEGGNLREVVRSLCSLKSLDLSYNQLQGNLLEPRVNSSTAECTDFALEILDLSTNVISGHIPAWLGEEFRSLKFLFLGHNNISGEIPKSIGMLSSMQSLDISSNMISGEIPKFIGMLSSMESLGIFGNMISGEIPTSLGMLSSMTYLDISNNMISGEIPALLGMLSSMTYLDISNNMISGEIPMSLGMLSSMKILRISYNPLEAAVLSESHFVNLSNLKTLDMRLTSLTLKLSSNWVPPFQLEKLFVESCKINGPFPQWIKTQKELGNLNLKNANIHGVLPKWFHKMHSLQYVHLSNNQITGCPIFPIHFEFFSLSNNSISCLFMPNDRYKNVIYNEASSVDLSDNNISGKLPEYLYHKMPALMSLDISNNQLNGSIPKSMRHFTSLVSLYLSSNKLSGNIPCFNSTSLYFLHLNDNLLSGDNVPSCLANLSSLTVLDLGENELSGGIPTWLTVNNVPHLQILRLRSNKLKGSIPKQLCSLSKLQLLDLGHNYLTRTIPNCLSNLTSMMHPVNYSQFDPPNYEEKDGVSEVMLGIERRYTTTLGFLLSINLSCNNLVGSIPDGITNLQGMFNLNLSYNQLTGLIPRNIGGLKSLVSLDFSRNKIHGNIPTSMVDLYALEHIDLSYNNFSGQIPIGHQLQTLDDPSNYAGNPYLCGDPLPKKCKSKKDSSKNSGHENDNQGEGDDDMHDKMWFYLIVMSGFATGFWGVVGTLLLKKSWRHALFRRVEDAQDWFYVAIVVWMAKLKKKWDASSDGSKYIGG